MTFKHRHIVSLLLPLTTEKCLLMSLFILGKNVSTRRLAIYNITLKVGIYITLLVGHYSFLNREIIKERSFKLLNKRYTSFFLG